MICAFVYVCLCVLSMFVRVFGGGGGGGGGLSKSHHEPCYLGSHAFSIKIPLGSFPFDRCITIFQQLILNDNFCRRILHIFVKSHWGESQ